MNVLNSCFNVNNSSKLFQENFVAELTPLQKKVALIALAIVALIISCAIYTYFTKQKVTPENKILPEYNVHVETLTGKTITFKVKPETTIGSFKEMFYKSEGVPAEDMKLTFAGKHLEDQYSFKDYQITKDKNIQAVFGLKGD